MSKKEKVLEYLKKHKTITQLEALKMWWDWRLSASIYSLRKDGYNIASEQLVVQKADGTTGHVAKYILENENHIPRID